MSTSFKPATVPSDIVARWPMMALSLWKQSFRYQAPVLLSAALVFKFFPAWSTIFAFLVAPSLFIVAFAIVQMTDEWSRFSWKSLLEGALPGAVRLCQVSLRFGALFGLFLAALAGVAAMVTKPVGTQAAADVFTETPHVAAKLHVQPDTLAGEFLHFCATWTEGVMATMFLGIFIIAIYQGVFGAVLHAQEGIGDRESRVYGWQAWQVNAGSFAKALQDAPWSFWRTLAVVIFIVICAFQTVYLSPVGLVLATYIPCLAYVAYRSIFLGRHENVPATSRVGAQSPSLLVPVLAR